MHSRGALAVGLAAATADAFLIPSSASLPDLSVFDADRVVAAPGAFSSSIPGEDVHWFNTPSSPAAARPGDAIAEGHDPLVPGILPWLYSAARGDAVAQGPEGFRDPGTRFVFFLWDAAEDHGDMHSFIDCPGCDFTPEQQPEEPVALDESNMILLDFALSLDHTALTLNGNPVFPPSAITGPLYARQRASHLDGNVVSRNRQLSWATAVNTRTTLSGDLVHTVNFCVLGLDDDESVDLGTDGCATVDDFFERDGLLYTLNDLRELDESEPIFINLDPAATADNGCPAGPMFSVMMCRLRNTFMDKAEEWNILSPAARPHRPHAPEHGEDCPGRFKFHEDGIDVPLHYPSLPHLHGGAPKFAYLNQGPDAVGPEHPHPPHSRVHHAIHAVASALRFFVVSFVVPVLIGVAAGMAASFIGMLVGSLIGFLWVKLVRGGKRGNATAAQEAREAQFAADDADSVYEEKEALLDHVPAFPAGEAPPVYAEKE